MPAAVVRAAAPADIPAVLELWARGRSAYARTRDTAESLERLLRDAPRSLWIAEADGGGVIGAVIAGWDGWRGNLYRLAVDPAHRRRGIGRTLVEAAEAELRSRGARRVTALVIAEDDAATAVWRSAGYDLDETIGRFVRSL
jgi:ribosomal protein S18 acetylase RimI-like enzyme